MTTIGRSAMYCVLAGGLLFGSTAYAITAAQQCEASKLETAGKYDFCRLRAEAKALKTGSGPDYSKCDPKFAAKWTQAECAAGGQCPSTGDAAAVQAYVTRKTDTIKAELDAGSTALLSPLVSTGETTSFGPGSDGDLHNGVPRSYTDNGDGTITDNASGLMWEKKSLDGSVHDVGNLYSWGMVTSPYTMNGAMVTTFLAALNAGSGFAGHTDWRIPNLAELQSIVNYADSSPAVSLVFNRGCTTGCTPITCSCTVTDCYWASTSIASDFSSAWTVDFDDGSLQQVSKSVNWFVRAVRGGP